MASTAASPTTSVFNQIGDDVTRPLFLSAPFCVSPISPVTKQI